MDFKSEFEEEIGVSYRTIDDWKQILWTDKVCSNSLVQTELSKYEENQIKSTIIIVCDLLLNMKMVQFGTQCRKAQ